MTAGVPTDTPWTDERIATLRELWLKGLSAGVIAAQLGLGRNAVVGKVHRLGLVARATIVSVHGPRKEPRRRGPRAKPSPLKNLFASAQSGRWRQDVTLPGGAASARSDAVADTGIEADGITDLAPETPPDGGVTLLELTGTTCRWPIGDPRDASFRFCGCREADIAKDRPYCSAHTILALGVAGRDYGRTYRERRDEGSRS